MVKTALFDELTQRQAEQLWKPTIEAAQAVAELPGKGLKPKILVQIFSDVTLDGVQSRLIRIEVWHSVELRRIPRAPEEHDHGLRDLAGELCAEIFFNKGYGKVHARSHTG